MEQIQIKNDETINQQIHCMIVHSTDGKILLRNGNQRTFLQHTY